MYAVSEQLPFGSKDDAGGVGKRTMINCLIRLVTFPVELLQYPDNYGNLGTSGYGPKSFCTAIYG